MKIQSSMIPKLLNTKSHLGRRVFSARYFECIKSGHRFLASCSHGNSELQSQHNTTPSSLETIPLVNTLAKSSRSIEEWACRRRHGRRFSTVPELSQEHQPELDLLTLIQSTTNDLEGPYHCWLNKVNGSKDDFKKWGAFLVLANIHFEDSRVLGSHLDTMIDNVKLLQQRFPLLHVLGFQSGNSVCSAANKTRLIHSVMKEYITFPILLCTKKIAEMRNGSCYILFKDVKNPLVHLNESLDLADLIKAIEDLNMQPSENSKLFQNSKGTGLKQTEVVKEPHVSLSMRNLLLNFPGCISIDECEHRLFVSDSNHHRIVIVNGDGKILDCIGSFPGFEDGDFESAKLVRPASSFYNSADDCLYFADSENHAIRRADMNRRVVETLYPSTNANIKDSRMLTWIMNKMGMEREPEARSEEFDPESLLFPWHLMRSTDDSFLIINRSFQMLWSMDLASGKIKEVVRGFPKIREIFGQMITEKLSLLNNIPCDWLQQEVVCNSSLHGIPYAGLASSLAAFKDYILICDTLGQRVLKFNCESGKFSRLEFSNFGILGLPYWLASSLERVHVGDSGNVVQGTCVDHVQSFILYPGKVDIKINVDIPVDTELLEPLQGGCIWRQARGAAAVISEADEETSSEKAGTAQLWYDELDNLAFVTPESESSVEEENTALDSNLDYSRPCIDCAVNTSPGTSEVIIYAALYLKLRKNQQSERDDQENYATRIENITNSERRVGMARDPFIHSLPNLNGDLGDHVFVKPLHLKIKLNTLDYPKAENSKDFIITDSSVEVDVSLNS